MQYHSVKFSGKQKISKFICDQLGESCLKWSQCKGPYSSQSLSASCIEMCNRSPQRGRSVSCHSECPWSSRGHCEELSSCSLKTSPRVLGSSISLQMWIITRAGIASGCSEDFCVGCLHLSEQFERYLGKFCVAAFHG